MRDRARSRVLTSVTQLEASMPKSSNPTPPPHLQATVKALWVRNETYTNKILQVGMLEKKSADKECTLSVSCMHTCFTTYKQLSNIKYNPHSQ